MCLIVDKELTQQIALDTCQEVKRWKVLSVYPLDDIMWSMYWNYAWKKGVNKWNELKNYNFRNNKRIHEGIHVLRHKTDAQRITDLFSAYTQVVEVTCNTKHFVAAGVWPDYNALSEVYTEVVLG